MIKSISLYIYVFAIFISIKTHGQDSDYRNYHQNIITIENLIAEEQFAEALSQYEVLFENYEFVFVRDYKIAAQLAALLSENKKAFELLRKGILAGWDIKHIKRNHLLKRLRSDSNWKQLKSDYKSLHDNYNKQLNLELQKQIKKMFSKDQWKALKAALKFSEKGQQRYLTKKFAPHSESQIKTLLSIFESQGYPGERLVGNNYWTSTIISHHNSITSDYARQDALYTSIKPFLSNAFKLGHISPFEMAIIDEWYLMTKNNDGKTLYGILETPKPKALEEINGRRTQFGLRTIETRDKLLALQESLNIHFYLDGDPW